ncbi:MAG: DUF2500 domain-containing protein [Clostridiales bacterium]|nr:DUF2500 domain-containing protein [Clostridiales bacterium]
MGFDLIFEIFPILFMIVFGIVLAVFVVSAVRGISQWNKNNHSPRLTVSAAVVSKRANVTHHHHSDSNGMGHSHSSTTYYVTFQVESGDRMELHVPSHEYGMLVEGDRGALTFQGTRYLGFARQ